MQTNRHITTSRTRYADKSVQFETKFLTKKARANKGRRLGMMKKGLLKTAHCTQCKRGMDGHIAKLQIENKRENAPICIPCIVGMERKPLVI